MGATLSTDEFIELANTGRVEEWWVEEEVEGENMIYTHLWYGYIRFKTLPKDMRHSETHVLLATQQGSEKRAKEHLEEIVQFINE